MKRQLIALSLAFSVLAVTSAQAAVCPFCSAVSQTFSEEMASMDVAVFAKLSRAAASPDTVPDPTDVVRAEFTIIGILKGDDFVELGDTFETVYFGEADESDVFLVQGIRPPSINWTTPLRLTERSQNYLKQLDSLPESGADRLEFFQNHLEDAEEMLARDAYDEFAKAPYDDVRALKDRMDREQLIQWLQDPDIPASRKRLYFTMLGVCGDKSNLKMLESLMNSDDRRQKAGLDAMIACYLTLSGPEGMPAVEDLFLKNADADYSDTYAAIAALRFHGTEADIIPRERIVKGLAYMLDRPALADLVIPDLARWEDWSVMDRLVVLFKTADEKTSWVRVPVINYMRACPLPEAKKYLVELEKIDPDAVRRASTFFPVLDDEDDDEEIEDLGPIGEPADGTNDGVQQADFNDQTAHRAERIGLGGPGGTITTSVLTVTQGPNQDTTESVETTAEPSADERFVSTTQSSASEELADAELAANDTGASALVGQSDGSLSPGLMILAMALFCIGVFAIQWSILTGRVVRLFN